MPEAKETEAKKEQAEFLKKNEKFDQAKEKADGQSYCRNQ